MAREDELRHTPSESPAPAGRFALPAVPLSRSPRRHSRHPGGRLPRRLPTRRSRRRPEGIGGARFPDECAGRAAALGSPRQKAGSGPARRDREGRLRRHAESGCRVARCPRGGHGRLDSVRGRRQPANPVRARDNHRYPTHHRAEPRRQAPPGPEDVAVEPRPQGAHSEPGHGRLDHVHRALRANDRPPAPPRDADDPRRRERDSGRARLEAEEGLAGAGSSCSTSTTRTSPPPT